MKIIKPNYILPLVLLALLMGISGGSVRLGDLSWVVPGAAAQHGLLMVGGFLGTLISLERAMVMKHKGWLVVPLLSGLSVPVMLWMGNPTLGGIMLLMASIGLVLIMYFQSFQHQVLEQYVISLGAVCWLLGNAMVLKTGFIPAGVSWWIGFILLTIVGERLELSKFLPTPQWAKVILLALIFIFFVSLLLPFHGYGALLLGMSMVLAALWLFAFDMAKVAAKKVGQFRYIGIGLRFGYIWLGLSGLILSFFSHSPFHYDLFVHSFFLGFTFSMIWAHAPIILPVVLNIKEKPYHPILWFGWIVFQMSLIGRIVFSALEIQIGRTMFGLINGYSILAMFALMALIVLIKSLKKRSNFIIKTFLSLI
ncbi:hypothetical protein A33Q_2126 [Indibacter alkaliphilus LW1]|uniref:Uncharacterized protein n=1 Tax=Indibacter alkaliphilus (strain CCUG 57479 / KCTC 22604 / LW1) TaxID=1189612 RepID=S2DXH6_INDAL|nr:hypothetical protein [Indibacter alkaliphilus]EOZ96816.1 hypothetical protein A33Q_2126 [Indibacter alkaliphilus LW1]